MSDGCHIAINRFRSQPMPLIYSTQLKLQICWTSIKANARNSSPSDKNPKSENSIQMTWSNFNGDLYLTINFYCFRSMLKIIYGIEYILRFFPRDFLDSVRRRLNLPFSKWNVYKINNNKYRWIDNNDLIIIRILVSNYVYCCSIFRK